MKPYNQSQISKNEFIREFHENIDSSELIWHKDAEDRIIESVEKTDWLFQIDNELPIKIEGKIFIPKETYHRIIKGTGNIKIRLQKFY